MSAPSELRPAPLPAVMAVTFVASIGTSVFWNGLSFVAKHQYHFTEHRSLLLYLATGIVYIFGAAYAGRLSRMLSHRFSPRTMLAANMGVLAVATLAMQFEGHEWPLWMVACLSSLLSSVFWPMMETYVTAGRHGAQMRSALGWWNLSWTSAVSAALFLMAPLVANNMAGLAIVALGPLNLLGILLVFTLPRQPPVHCVEESAAEAGGEYSWLLKSARVLLPASYLLVGTISPILPYLMQKLSIDPRNETQLAAVWTIARVLAMALMWRLAFWHGRWATLLVGAAAMTGGFAIAMLAPGVEVMIGGLAAFGAGLGIVYYAAIYYAMTVGHAEVDAGGTHEALIGVGYAIGPIAGLAGGALGGGAATIVIVWTLVACAAVPACVPYFKARARRTALSSIAAK